jgi:hypothetical protein
MPIDDKKFVLELDKFATKFLPQDALKFHRAIHLHIAGAFIQRSPVDRGFLRNAWFSTLDRPTESRPAGPSKSGSASMASARSAMNQLRQLGRDSWFSNNMPYAVVVDNGDYPNPPKKPTGKTAGGYSVQAPNGIVGPVLTETEAWARSLPDRKVYS